MPMISMTHEKIRQDILRMFLSQTMFDNIFDMVDDPNDEETVEECFFFVGKKWMDIDNKVWRKNFRAISFFNDSAKLLFFPSVMVEMLTNPSNTELAFSSYIYEMSHCIDHCKVYELFIYDSDKSSCFCSWLELMVSNKDLEYEHQNIKLIINQMLKAGH